MPAMTTTTPSLRLDALSLALLELLRRHDPEVSRILADEAERQASTLELIASENHVSPAVMHAMGTWMTNKYAEGYPGKRYYGGCEFHDQAEDLARERAKKLFSCGYANVQPHSGANANVAAFMAMLKPGEKILSLPIKSGVQPLSRIGNAANTVYYLENCGRFGWHTNWGLGSGCG